MKHFYLTALSVAAALTLNAAQVQPLAQKTPSWLQPQQNVVSAKLPAADIKTMLPTRSAEEPQTDLEASEASYYYLGDLFQNGTDCYYIFLSSAGIRKGNPTDEGQMLRALIVAEKYTGSEQIPPLPTGTFAGEVSGEAGTYYPDNTEFMDIFFNPDDPEDPTLVGYVYQAAEGGSIRIAEKDGKYTVQAVFTGDLLDENGNSLDTAECTALYSGEIKYDDIHGYTPLGADAAPVFPHCSGRYSQGLYSIAFYNVPLDEDGFIIGAGELLNCEIYTEESNPMNLEDLVDTFEPFDAFEVGGGIPGKFVEGVWYEVYGGYFAPVGTAMMAYDASGDYKTGLATGGTIDVTREGDIFTFKFNLTTPEGDKITSSWTGELAKFITDLSDPSGSVQGVDPDIAAPVYGGKGCIVAPADALIFNTQGAVTGSTDLTPGIYIVKTGSKAVKVVVK